MIGGERPLLHDILGKTDRAGAKSPIFDLFSLVAPQPQHLAKKVQLSLIGSCIRAFDWYQNRSRSLYVVVRPSVVCLSVTFVRATRAIEIFGNVSTPFGTLAIC